MWAICKRELKAVFWTVTGWLFLAATLCLFGLYFFVYNLSYGYPYLSYTLSAITFLFLITVPVLTMRVYSEERKTKTDQLILTAPVSVGKIVLGKYLAMAAVFTISAAVISITPLFLRIFGEIPFGECYCAILGFWLYGLTCIAIGTFLSSITESQVIAAVLSFVVLFIGYMMDGITSLISSTGNMLTTILGCFNLAGGLENYFNGILDVKALIYYVSLIALFLFFTAQSIQKRRFSISTAKIKLGVFSSGFIAVAIAAVVFVNLIADQLPSAIASFDVTSQKLYSITEKTLEVLNGLEEDITIYVLASEKSQDDTLKTTLERYAEHSEHISIVYKDPNVSPTFYQDYTSDAVTSNSLIVESAKRTKVIDYNDIYQYDVDYTTYSTTLTGYDGEGQLTSAITYVTSDDNPVIYQLTGHDEAALSGTFLDAVEKLNQNLETINLLQYDAIPEDADLLIINSPASDFSEDDVTKIMNYLNQGGDAMIVSSYTDKKLTNFEALLANYEVHLTEGMIVESDRQHYYQSPFYLLPDIESTSYTTDAADGYIFAPYSQGLTFPDVAESAEASDTTYTPLLTTSDNAYSKTKLTTMESYDKEEGDIDGPFTIGLVASKAYAADEEDTSDLYIFTSADLLTDSASNMVYGNNATLFSGILSQYGSSEAASVVPVKSYQASNLTITQGTIIAGGIFCVLLLPAGLLITGIVIWVKRRKR